jgi:GH15 family glucan-1,4-alpha-glucosidase
LPEQIGGIKNWDYRFAWIRDTSFTIDALINLGLDEEVHRVLSWIITTIGRHGPDLQVFYTLDGELASEEIDLDVPGYRQSAPAREGNGAATQCQLGTYGDLFDTVFRYCERGHLLDTSTSQMLATIADHCCNCWATRDSGIWELDQLEHYTISKIGCWVALDRAVRLARAGQMPDERSHRWRIESERIRDWVNEYCWSETKGSYTFFAGTDRLDAAVLLAGRTGFERGERLTSTVDAVVDELGHGPLLYRYSGMDKEEGAFVACTFWLVDALALIGDLKQAHTLMDKAVHLVNDVGLLSEQIDPDSGAFLGNFPQGLSHLALINAAFTLQREAQRAQQLERQLVRPRPAS